MRKTRFCIYVLMCAHGHAPTPVQAPEADMQYLPQSRFTLFFLQGLSLNLTLQFGLN